MVAVSLSEERDEVREGLRVHSGREDGSKGLATGRPEREGLLTQERARDI